RTLHSFPTRRSSDLQNPKNGHAHIGYELKAPVSTTTASKQKIIDYLAVIEAGMARKMGADSGYSGLLTKNPCHTYWRTTIWTREDRKSTRLNSSHVK